MLLNSLCWRTNYSPHQSQTKTLIKYNKMNYRKKWNEKTYQIKSQFFIGFNRCKIALQGYKNFQMLLTLYFCTCHRPGNSFWTRMALRTALWEAPGHETTNCLAGEKVLIPLTKRVRNSIHIVLYICVEGDIWKDNFPQKIV